MLFYPMLINTIMIIWRQTLVMSHSLCRIWIHGIWSTKEWQPFIAPSIERRIHEQMYNEFQDIDCPARIINGMPDHVTRCSYLAR